MKIFNMSMVILCYATAILCLVDIIMNKDVTINFILMSLNIIIATSNVYFIKGVKL